MSHAFIDSFIEYLIVERSAPGNTITAYQNDLKHFSAWLQQQNRDIHTLEPGDLAAFSSACKDRGMKSTSISRRLSTIRQFYRFLLEEGCVQKDPTRDMSRPKRGRYLPAVLSTEEVDRLLDAPDVTTPLGIRDKAMIELLYATGLRVSELVGIEVHTLLVFGMSCPLTVLARRLSSSQRANFDIFLPEWLARYNKAICSAILLAVLAGMAWRLSK